MKHIADIKSNMDTLHIDQLNDGLYEVSSTTSKWKLTCNKDQYDLLTELYDVQEVRKPYSRAVLRTKMVESCGAIANAGKFTLFNELVPNKKRMSYAFIHLNYYLKGDDWHRNINFLKSMNERGIIDYLVIAGNVVKFNVTDFNAIYELPHVKRLFNNGSRIRVTVGINSLKFFKYFTLSGINSEFGEIVGDYSQYTSSNSVIHKINDELEGTY